MYKQNKLIQSNQPLIEVPYVRIYQVTVAVVSLRASPEPQVATFVTGRHCHLRF
jgi:hypothetical protein